MCGPRTTAAKFTSQGLGRTRTDAQIKYLYYPLNTEYVYIYIYVYLNLKPQKFEMCVLHVYIYTHIYIKLKNLFKAYIKNWVKPRNTLYLKQYFVTLYVTLSSLIT